MKIELKEIPTMTIEEFADLNGLTMEVCERRQYIGCPYRYYASFHGVEVKSGRMLEGAYGDGPTPEAAINEYAFRISMKRLVYMAGTPERREFDAPRFKPGPPGTSS